MNIENERNRLIFYALLEQSMRYMEGFYREEIKSYGDISPPKTELSRSARKNYEKETLKIREKLVKNKLELYQSLQKKADSLLERMQSEMNNEQKIKMDNFSVLYGEIARRLLDAKDHVEVLTLIDLYNEDYFDAMFKKARGEQEK